MKDKINMLAMRDTTRNSKIALPVIMVFEIYMLISWLSKVQPENSIKYYGYPVLYAMLLIISGIVLVLIQKYSKQMEKNHKKIMKMQTGYAVFFVLWSLGITYIGACYRDSFSELLYVTIITLVPIFCYIGSAFWMVVQVISAVFMFVLAYMKVERIASFRTNFIVFTIISIIACRSLYRLRRDSYLRQLHLEASAEANRRLAFFDTLTGLPNRRNYEEEISKIKESKETSCVIGMFDLNGLKYTNDNMGHDAGDALLTGAAGALETAFEGKGTVYRVGGDEFAGIFYMDKGEQKEALKTLKQYEKTWTKDNKIKLSIACGFADGKEIKASIEELETIADDEMYANKKKYYEGKNDV